jgi:hypothetical protein
MWHPDKQHGAPAVPDRQQFDRSALGTLADDLETGDPGKLSAQCRRATAELLERQEFPVFGDTLEEFWQRATNQDSAFEE